MERLKLDRRDPKRPRDPPPAFKTSRGEGVYEVDKIVAHRRSPRTGKLEYHVTWVGYAEDDGEWLEKSRLKHAAEVL